MQSMKDALKKRRNAGVNVTIVLGSPDDKKDEQETKELGLAPEVKDALPQDQSLMQEPGAKPESPHPDEAQDRDLIEKILAGHSEQESGPMDIGKRARMAARAKYKK